MSEYHLAVIGVGKIEAAEIEAVLTRTSRLLRRPIEFRGQLGVPQGIEDRDRRQFRAAELLKALRSRLAQLPTGQLVGLEQGADTKPPPRADAHIFVTDVDLFTSKSDGVFAAFNSTQSIAVVSVRRLREAFYRRPADQAKQRTRLVKEVSRMAGRLKGTKQCPDPNCLLSPSKQLVDLDLKEEKYCRVCSEWLFQGTLHV